jgi:hypothetical protein
MADTYLTANKPSLSAATYPRTIAIVSQGKLHGNAQDIPASLFQQHGCNAAVHATAHENSNLFGSCPMSPRL